MIYGKRPEGMGDGEWLIECQCRHVAREMRRGRDRVERRTIFEQWQQRLPAISRARVAEIWREGVPMPARTAAKGERA